MTDYTGELRDWHAERTGDHLIVHGRIYGDARGRFPDGELIHTSAVTLLDMNKGHCVTRNSVYKLTGAQP